MKKLPYPMMAIFVLIAMLFIKTNMAAQTEELQSPQVAKVKDAIDVYHGTKVHDPYRWLENWQNPEVRKWSNQQNRYARSYLNNLPGIQSLEQRITQIMSAFSQSYFSLAWRKHKLFAMKKQPPLNHPLLVTFDSAVKPKSEKIIVDLNQFDPTGNTSIDWFVPSWTGELVAVSMSKGGSESGDLYIFETNTGKQMDIVIRGVNKGTAGGDLAWLPDGSGFFYTRYPREGKRPKDDLNFFQEVWFHRLGDSESQDKYVIGKEFDRIAEIRLEIEPKSGQLLVTVQYGDSGKFKHFLLTDQGNWKQISKYEDEIVQVIFGSENELFLISRKNAPKGKILKLPVQNPNLDAAKTIIPEGDDTIISSFYYDSKMIATQSYLYLTYQLGGPSEIRVFDHNGDKLGKPEILPISSIYELLSIGGDRLLYRNASYLEPPAWFIFDPKKGTSTKTVLFNKSPVDFSNAEVVRKYATSKDGTKIPVNIIRPKNIKLDGKNPVLLYGYGGFGISITPGFRPLRKLWIEQGAVYAVANIRGGGEFGEKWHREGSLTNKQNCFDDFAAAMQYLIDAGYTNRDQLAIMGGSNGGLLMGAMITQHPDLFRVTVSSVGLYDMIRSELTPNGAFNIPEYGTVENPEQFKALYSYSPYHNVKDGVEYPSVLFMTGANDPRVDPMHSRKMTARLQAANSSDNPILLRTSSETGHGYGTPLNARIKENVHIYGFLFHELGMKFHNSK